MQARLTLMPVYRATARLPTTSNTERTGATGRAPRARRRGSWAYGNHFEMHDGGTELEVPDNSQ